MRSVVYFLKIARQLTKNRYSVCGLRVIELVEVDLWCLNHSLADRDFIFVFLLGVIFGRR